MSTVGQEITFCSKSYFQKKVNKCLKQNKERYENSASKMLKPIFDVLEGEQKKVDKPKT